MVAASIAALFLPHNGLMRYDRTLLSGQDCSSDFLRERASSQCSHVTSRCVPVWISQKMKQTLTSHLRDYSSLPPQWLTDHSPAKHWVVPHIIFQSLKQQTNPKVGNIRELPHRNQPLWSFTPQLVPPHWVKSKLSHRQDPCFSKGLWGWEGRR